MPFVKQENMNYKFKGVCVITGEEYQTEEVEPEQLFWYNNGRLIQEAFPHLSANDREFIMSQISPKGWEQMNGGKGK